MTVETLESGTAALRPHRGPQRHSALGWPYPREDAPEGHAGPGRPRNKQAARAAGGSSIACRLRDDAITKKGEMTHFVIEFRMRRILPPYLRRAISRNFGSLLPPGGSGPDLIQAIGGYVHPYLRDGLSHRTSNFRS